MKKSILILLPLVLLLFGCSLNKSDLYLEYTKEFDKELVLEKEYLKEKLNTLTNEEEMYQEIFKSKDTVATISATYIVKIGETDKEYSDKIKDYNNKGIEDLHFIYFNSRLEKMGIDKLDRKTYDNIDWKVLEKSLEKLNEKESRE